MIDMRTGNIFALVTIAIWIIVNAILTTLRIDDIDDSIANNLGIENSSLVDMDTNKLILIISNVVFGVIWILFLFGSLFCIKILYKLSLILNFLLVFFVFA